MKQMIMPYILLVLLAGALMPFQPLINSRLGSFIGGPLCATLANFTVGLTAVLFLIFVCKVAHFNAAGVAQTSLWMWAGGLIGALLVVSSTLAAPQIGTATLIALLLAGQLTVSIVIDHFGIMMDAPHPASLLRIAGVFMLAGGVYLIQKF